jgi:hypothetical protein
MKLKSAEYHNKNGSVVYLVQLNYDYKTFLTFKPNNFE